MIFVLPHIYPWFSLGVLCALLYFYIMGRKSSLPWRFKRHYYGVTLVITCATLGGPFFSFWPRNFFTEAVLASFIIGTLSVALLDVYVGDRGSPKKKSNALFKLTLLIVVVAISIYREFGGHYFLLFLFVLTVADSLLIYTLVKTKMKTILFKSSIAPVNILLSLSPYFAFKSQYSGRISVVFLFLAICGSLYFIENLEQKCPLKQN